MRVLDLFSGAGMMAYGMEKAGFKTAAFCEIEPWPRRVLAKHWPDVPIYEDVRDVTAKRIESDGVGRIDIITGGFPCQDLSVAGKQAGIKGERSGLFDEILRIACDLRAAQGFLPILLLENVAALLTGADGEWARYVFGRLSEVGFDAEWHVIPAGDSRGCLSAGAPHRRERVWIVAYPAHSVCERDTGAMAGAEGHRHDEPPGREEPASDHKGCGEARIQAGGEPAPCSGEPGDVAYPERIRQQRSGQSVNTGDSTPDGEGQTDKPVDVGEPRIGTTEPDLGLLANGIATRLARSRWLPEPRIGRVATGVPDRAQKLKALGNGLVWQIPYAIGRAIMESQA